jgi:YHS domain-containing protein
MIVDPSTAPAVRQHEGRNYFFCRPECAEAFEADPSCYLEPSRS